MAGYPLHLQKNGALPRSMVWILTQGDNKIELDSIVGCIPQILKPNPEAMSKIITENLSEEFLHSLSSYYALQVCQASFAC